MKVRATQDGHYGGYFRIGPHEEPDGSMAAGEVFEIDATPHPVRDENGKPIQEMEQTGEISPITGQPIMRPVYILDHNGKPKKDAQGKLIPKAVMATFFSPEWMEPVNEDATVDYPNESAPLGVIAQMQPGQKARVSVAARPVNLPDDIKAILGVKQPAEVASKNESPI